MPKTKALMGAMRWAATGRFIVRDIIASMSWSKKWLMALAPPAPSVPPRQTMPSACKGGMPSAARNMPPIAVMTSKTMIGGLVSVT